MEATEAAAGVMNMAIGVAIVGIIGRPHSQICAANLIWNRHHLTWQSLLQKVTN